MNESSNSMITCLTWIRRGKAKSQPKKVQISKDDIKKAIEQAQQKLEADEEGEEIEEVDNENDPKNNDNIDIKTEEKEAEIEAALDAAMSVKSNTKKKKKKKKTSEETKELDDKIEKDLQYINDINAKYRMDDYDEEDMSVSNPLAGIANLTVYADNNDDPYITLKEENDSDEEDFEIKDTDNLIIMGQATPDYCNIEKHVYNAELVNLYVHDDFFLSSFPLTIEWLDFDMTEDKPGNFIAVGTMEPTIDIWDVDVVHGIEPMATLGQKVKSKKKKKGLFGHRDAVLDLSWNQNARHVLASASADKTVLVWDLTEGRVAMSLTNHTDKVQCVKWHPFEEHMLLSGSFDKTVMLFDCRTTETSHKSWSMSGEIEKILWNHHSPLNFFASTDTGHIYYMDTRQDKPLYTLSAHNDAVTGMSLSSTDPSVFVTSSVDETVKIWDISDNRPSSILTSNVGIGKIHCMQNCPDEPYVFAFGGAKQLKVWDIRDNSDVFSHFCGGGPKIKGDTVSMEIETGNVAMETDSTDVTETGDLAHKKKKKKKKKKKQSPMT